MRAAIGAEALRFALPNPPGHGTMCLGAARLAAARPDLMLGLPRRFFHREGGREAAVTRTIRLPIARPADPGFVPDDVFGLPACELVGRHMGTGRHRERIESDNLYDLLESGDLVLSVCIDPQTRTWREVSPHVIGTVSRDSYFRVLEAGRGTAFGVTFEAARIREDAWLPLAQFQREWMPERDGTDRYWQPLFHPRPSHDAHMLAALHAEWAAWDNHWVASAVAAGRLDVQGDDGTGRHRVPAEQCVPAAIDLKASRIGAYRDVMVRLPDPIKFSTAEGAALDTVNPEKPRNKGGRKPEYDWAEFEIEARKRLSENTEISARLVNAGMMDWCRDKWGKVRPTLATVGARMREIRKRGIEG